MAYSVSFSDEAFEQYIECVEYLQYILENHQAAASLIEDVDKGLERLRRFANVYDVCENPNLAAREIRRLRLKHRYKLFYHIEGNAVVIDAMLHNLQDFESKLK